MSSLGFYLLRQNLPPLCRIDQGLCRALTFLYLVLLISKVGGSY